MARTVRASRSALSVDPYAVPMKKARECPRRAMAPSGSIDMVGVPSSRRRTRREWCIPIQKMLGSRRSRYDAHCRPKISAGVWEWTYQVALSGPNHPGSPAGLSNSIPRKNFARTFSSNLPLSHDPSISCGRSSGTHSVDGNRTGARGTFIGRPFSVPTHGGRAGPGSGCRYGDAVRHGRRVVTVVSTLTLWLHM